MDRENFLTNLSYKFEKKKKHIMTKKNIFDKITHFKNKIKKYKYSNITRILLKSIRLEKKPYILFIISYHIIILLIVTHDWYPVSAYNDFNFPLNL